MEEDKKYLKTKNEQNEYNINKENLNLLIEDFKKNLNENNEYFNY